MHTALRCREYRASRASRTRYGKRYFTKLRSARLGFPYSVFRAVRLGSDSESRDPRHAPQDTIKFKIPHGFIKFSLCGRAKCKWQMASSNSSSAAGCPHNVQEQRRKAIASDLSSGMRDEHLQNRAAAPCESLKCHVRGGPTASVLLAVIDICGTGVHRAAHTWMDRGLAGCAGKDEREVRRQGETGFGGGDSRGRDAYIPPAPRPRG